MDKIDFLALARKQYKDIQTIDFHNRVTALEDLEFTYDVGDGQWDPTAKADRAAKRRPCLTHNKVRKFVAQVANRQRMNRLAMDTVPVDDLADKEIALLFDGHLRQIENQSDADVIYATQGEKALAGGWGYWRILTKFADDSFEQEIYIEGIDNQFSVHLDPEGNYGFIRKPLLEAEFKEQYPNAEPTDFDQSSFGEDYGLWFEGERVYIAEYFKKVSYTKTIAQVLRPNEVTPIVVELTDKITEEELKSKGYTVVKTRSFKSKKVKWYKITGHDILEEEDWVGNEIPIIEVKGDEVDISGKKYKRSLIRDARGPQILYNFSVTSLAEKISAVPKAPYLVTPDMIKGHEDMWDDANIENYPYLVVNETQMGMPKREQGAMLDSGFTGLLNIGDNDIKDTMGLYSSFSGEPSNERSGKAINARRQGSETGTFHFADNLARAILETARQIIYMIPRVYDTERTIRILGEDGTAETMVTINQKVNINGEDIIINDLTIGKYDVREGIKAWSTRRQEALGGMTEAMQYAPSLAHIIAPLLFKYQDWPGAEEIAQGAEEIKQQLLEQSLQGAGKPK